MGRRQEAAIGHSRRPVSCGAVANIDEQSMHDNFHPFHLFGATFASDEEAKRYAFEQWEPEPSNGATDAEYSAWEDRNPTWQLAEELEFYMDSDFVELLDSVADVITQIQRPHDAARVSSEAKAFTHFIIIIANPDAIWADRRSTSAQVKPVVRPPESTATVTYLGRFN